MEIRFRSPFGDQDAIGGHSVTANQTQSCGTVAVTEDDGGGDQDPGPDPDPAPGPVLSEIPLVAVGGAVVLVVLILLFNR